jgi:para-nitrobenzyl esterase
MSDPIVATEHGTVRGVRADGVVRFLGIPYAAPPVGTLRFRPPEAHPAWDGARDASALGPNAPQSVKPFPGLDVEPLIGTGWRKGDDFLNLNVWVPDRDEDAAGEPRSPQAGGAPRPRLPVMVWIHGGGFVIGSNYARIQDASAFARSGIVCFAINYRMGVEGFLPIPGVATNLGLRDMIFALHWIRRNAAGFGGDPDNITLFGESAGAMAIANLITSPLAQGLFRRAIVQSGHGGMVRPIPVAQRLVKKVARLLGVNPDEAGFRTATMEACVEAVAKVSLPTTRIDLRDEQGREPVFGISRFVPVYGDDVLPEEPLEALKKGAGAEIELLIGTNAEEMNLYLVPTGVRAKVGKLLAWFVLSRSQPDAWAVLAEYGRKTRGKRAGWALTAAMNDLVFRWPARRFAEEHKGRTHLYELDWRSDAFKGELGACHGMELPFVFDTLDCVTGPEGLAGLDPPHELAKRTHAIWAQFATDGSLPWPEYGSETRLVYQLEKGEAVHEPVMAAARYLP